MGGNGRRWLLVTGSELDGGGGGGVGDGPALVVLDTWKGPFEREGREAWGSIETSEGDY